MSGFDPARVAIELKWLQDNPDFAERPATMAEFLGPEYLNCEQHIRSAVREELIKIFGDTVSSNAIAKFQKAMITGAIGIGKTTIASVVLPYLAHWVLCLKDPQGFFNLLAGSRIAFMQMSTSGAQAKEVVFGDIKARINFSPWFKKYPPDKNFKNQLRFAKEVWILPGDSAETTFEGYNILGGILDEADSHKVTENKDYAEEGYSTINSRIESRFGAVKRNGENYSYGFIMVIGQMKRGTGFAARKFEEFQRDPGAYCKRMTIWESLGWSNYLNPDGTRNSFFYDSLRHEIIPTGLVADLGKNKDLIEVPEAYRTSFELNPEKALRDLAGIPPLSGSPFISLAYKVHACRDRWIARYNPPGTYEEGQSPRIKTPLDIRNRLEPWFHAPDAIKRACHLDMAYSPDGDALGFAMGHVSEMVERDGEWKPHIVFDLVMRWHAPAGREIFLGDVRHFIYHLKDDLKFKIISVTMDGFQSTDTRQQMQKRKMFSDILSVDKNMAPYEDLREAIYEDRVDFPEYMVKLDQSDIKRVEIVVKELSELIDTGKKVDHPEQGSKDVADAMAGVCYTLMGDRTYHRKKYSASFGKQQSVPASIAGSEHPAMDGMGAPAAPLPPQGDPFSDMPLWQPPSRRM